MPFTFTQSAFSALRAGTTGPVPTPWMGAPDDPAGMGAARDFAPSSSRAARSQHRVDKVRLMEEGSRTLQRHAAETLGAALDAGKAERAHARLKRMAAFDSHDYDPADNDLEEEALRARTKHDYKSANQWKWGLSVMIGVTMGFVAFTVDGLIDKLDVQARRRKGKRMGHRSKGVSDTVGEMEALRSKEAAADLDAELDALGE